MSDRYGLPGVRLSLVFFWMVAPDVRAPAGCPAAVAAGTSSFSFLCFRARLALVLGFSMVSSGVPEYAQGLCLK